MQKAKGQKELASFTGLATDISSMGKRERADTAGLQACRWVNVDRQENWTKS